MVRGTRTKAGHTWKEEFIKRNVHYRETLLKEKLSNEIDEIKTNAFTKTLTALFRSAFKLKRLSKLLPGLISGVEQKSRATAF